MLDPVCNVMNVLQFFLMHLTVALFVFAAHAALVWIPTCFCSSCSSCLDSDLFLQFMQLLSGFRHVFAAHAALAWIPTMAGQDLR
jgi:hypothetical protein